MGIVNHVRPRMEIFKDICRPVCRYSDLGMNE